MRKTNNESIFSNGHASAVVCMDSIIERLDGNHKLLADIIGEVLGNKYEKEFLGGIEKYIREENMEELGRHIHKYKGSLSYFRAEALNRLLGDMMEACRENDLIQIEKLFSRLITEYTLLKECLAAYLQEKP